MADVFSQGYALLIGVDENAVSKWALREVVKDIRALQEVLVHPERCAYPKDNVRLLSGPAATRQGILDGLAWLKAGLKSSENATGVVFYSGHGWRDKQANPAEYYLIPYDVSEDGLRSRALRSSDFAEEIEALQPRRLLVVLDCCHAAGMDVKDIDTLPARYSQAALPPEAFIGGEKALSPDEVSAAGGEAKTVTGGLGTLTQGEGRAVLSSSKGDQKSYLRNDRKMSIFTYHLIEALTGHAQPQGGAPEVLVSDVMSYVWRKVPASAEADWNAPQVPDYRLTGNFPVALVLGGKGLEAGAAPPDPLADLPKAGRTVTIHQGSYIEGDVKVDGDFVAGDKIVHGDEVRGDKTEYHIDEISGMGIAVGDGASVAMGAGPRRALDSAAFSRLEASQVQPEGVRLVRQLRRELEKGQAASDEVVAGIIQQLAGLNFVNPNLIRKLFDEVDAPGPVTRFMLENLGS